MRQSRIEYFFSATNCNSLLGSVSMDANFSNSIPRLLLRSLQNLLHPLPIPLFAENTNKLKPAFNLKDTFVVCLFILILIFFFFSSSLLLKHFWMQIVFRTLIRIIFLPFLFVLLFCDNISDKPPRSILLALQIYFVIIRI